MAWEPQGSELRGYPLSATSSGGRSPALASQHSLNRRKQINTLPVFNERVSEVQPDVRYQVDFTAASGPFQLQIHLPPAFPAERPHVVLWPPSTHPWLDARGNVVGAPGLRNYSVHSDLGRLVQAIKREFEKNPPQPRPEGAYGAGGTPTQGLAQIAPPAVSVVPGLADLDPSELRELADNEVALRHFCQNIPNPSMDRMSEEIAQCQAQIQTLVQANQDLGQSLVAQTVELTASLDNLERDRHALRHAFTTSYQPARQGLDTAALVDRLSRASLEAEESSEAMAELFQAGEMSVENFVKDYVSTRTTFHLRKAKVEKVKTANLS